MIVKKIDRDLPRSNDDLTINPKSDDIKGKTNVKGHQLNSSLGKYLLPSTIGIPPRNGSPENRVRDPRVPWAPAITISGKNDQPILTPQYQKKEQRVAEKSEQVKLNPKVITNADLSHLTRLGNDKTKLPISFLPHKNVPLRSFARIERTPGPASYQRYKDYAQIGEEYIYTRQPHIRIRPLIGSKLKREQRFTNPKKINLKDIKPFWTTIGTRTYDSRLPNAPVSAIHHRFGDTNEERNKRRGMTMPGPGQYDHQRDAREQYMCSSRGVTISPRYREKRLAVSGPGPAMVEREVLDKGYKNIFKKSPAFSMSSRWPPYSYTYTDECPENFF